MLKFPQTVCILVSAVYLEHCPKLQYVTFGIHLINHNSTIPRDCATNISDLFVRTDLSKTNVWLVVIRVVYRGIRTNLVAVSVCSVAQRNTLTLSSFNSDKLLRRNHSLLHEITERKLTRPFDKNDIFWLKCYQAQVCHRCVRVYIWMCLSVVGGKWGRRLCRVYSLPRVPGLSSSNIFISDLNGGARL